MKHIALLAVIGTALLALPSSASAQSGATKCPEGVKASAPGVEVSPSHIHVLPDSLGVSPSYACVYVEAPVTGNDIGGEAVIDNSEECSYVNGWTTNPGSPGYAGICTDAPHDDPPAPSCDGVDDGNGANRGGCFWIKPAPRPVNDAINKDDNEVRDFTDWFICGNTSGEDPDNSSRDGCSIP